MLTPTRKIDIRKICALIESNLRLILNENTVHVDIDYEPLFAYIEGLLDGQEYEKEEQRLKNDE